MANDVSTPIKAQKAMVADAHPIRTLMGGTKAMREAGTEYLPKEPAETQAAYEVRKKRSVLFNATGKTVIDLTGKVFTKPIVVEKGVDAKLNEWFENVDNAGRNLNVFARDTFFDALQAGIGFIFVDMPPAPERADGKPATLADEQTAGIRPYLTYIPLERLIGWKSTTVKGAEQLTQVRILECVSQVDPENEFNEIDIDQIRVVTANGLGTGCTWQTWRQQTGVSGNEIKWVPYQNGTMPLPEITLVPVYTNRTDFMQACPPLAKLAELNIAHWQSSSDQRNILHVARVPILFGAGFSETYNLAIGASEMVRSEDSNAKLMYVEHSGAAIDAGDKDLQNLVENMQAMGLQLLIDNVKGQSATGEIRDDAKENSPLAMMVTALQDALTQAIIFMAQMGGAKEPKSGDILLSKDFGIDGNRFDLQFLTQAVLGGKLSQETYWFELQRRGALSETFDPEVEAQRVADEAPVLGAGVPPGGGMNLDEPGTAH